MDQPLFNIKDLGTIKTTAKEKLQARIDYIIKELFQIGLYSKEDTALVGIENYSFGSRDRGILDRAELRGVILWHLYKSEVPFILIAPQSMKKFVSGSGNTKKDMIPMHVRQKYATEFLSAAIEPKDNNQADAVGLAAMTHCYWQWTKGAVVSKDLEKTFQNIKDQSG